MLIPEVSPGVSHPSISYAPSQDPDWQDETLYIYIYVAIRLYNIYLNTKTEKQNNKKGDLSLEDYAHL